MRGGELLRAHSAAQQSRKQVLYLAASERKIRIALRDQRIFYFDCINHFLHSGKY
ncbi:hypothetical protein C7212DRAFT_25082, partial [Tuber magnatum]